MKVHLKPTKFGKKVETRFQQSVIYHLGGGPAKSKSNDAWDMLRGPNLHRYE